MSDHHLHHYRKSARRHARKKKCLESGHRTSKGEIVCFTDADCFPPPHWVEELTKTFQPEVGLVAGYSPYQIPGDKTSTHGLFNNIFFNFIAYEEFRAAIWCAGRLVGTSVGSAQEEILPTDESV